MYKVISIFAKYRNRKFQDYVSVKESTRVLYKE